MDGCSECFSGLRFTSVVCLNICGLADAALWPLLHFGDTEASPSWKLFRFFFPQERPNVCISFHVLGLQPKHDHSQRKSTEDSGHL